MFRWAASESDQQEEFNPKLVQASVIKPPGLWVSGDQARELNWIFEFFFGSHSEDEPWSIWYSLKRKNLMLQEPFTEKPEDPGLCPRIWVTSCNKIWEYKARAKRVKAQRSGWEGSTDDYQVKGHPWGHSAMSNMNAAHAHRILKLWFAWVDKPQETPWLFIWKALFHYFQ